MRLLAATALVLGFLGCFWGAHPVLDTGHSAVGMAQRVRKPVDAVAGLPIAIEAHSNSSTAERKATKRRGKAKRQVCNTGLMDTVLS